MYNYAVLICTHGRPYAQHTLNTLRRCGYTGKIYLILDNEDETYPEYHTNKDYTDIWVFDKQFYINEIDTGVLEPKRKAILYAKSACESIATMHLGLDAFVIADDDITGFRYRYEDGNSLRSLPITQNMDEIIYSYMSYILDAGICATSFGNDRMYIGGKISDERKSEFRAPYNFVFRNSHIPFSWVSEMYEDTISPILENQRGHYTIQLPIVKYDMKELVAGADGGMSETYSQMPIYERIFQVIKYSPTSTKFVVSNGKITNSILREHTYPKLVSSSYKKTC